MAAGPEAACGAAAGGPPGPHPALSLTDVTSVRGMPGAGVPGSYAAHRVSCMGQE